MALTNVDNVDTLRAVRVLPVANAADKRTKGADTVDRGVVKISLNPSPMPLIHNWVNIK